MNRVLAFGSRDWPEHGVDHLIITALLTGLYIEHDVGWDVVHNSPFTLIEGQCPYGGADKIAGWWADSSPLHGPLLGSSEDVGRCSPVIHEAYPAQWDLLGKAAGPARNQEMLTRGFPKLAVGFCDDIRNSRGSRDMAQRASSAKVPTYIVSRYAR